MALSDYLTDDEWDACFYAHLNHEASNFGEVMHDTIDALLREGYTFQGLDEKGNKLRQIHSKNPSKILIFLGNPENYDVLSVIKNGREFLKKHCNHLVAETDAEWEEKLKSVDE